MLTKQSRSVLVSIINSLYKVAYNNLVRFGNGEINKRAKSDVKFSLYQPKLKHNQKKRVLVAKTDHLSYIGTSYPREGVRSSNSSCYR